MFSKIKFKIAKRHIVTITLMIVVFVMSLGYAALSQYMEIQGMAIVQKLWNVSVTDVTITTANGGSGVKNFVSGGTTVSLDTNLPDLTSTVTYTITFKNSGNVKGTLHSIDQIEDKNTNITYTISGVTVGTTIAAGGTATATVTVKYKEGATSISTEPKKMMLQFNFVEDTSSSGGSGSGGSTAATLSSKILVDNTAQSDSGIDFSQISSDTNGKGLYYTSTNTEGNLPTYYFRGAVENNYVVFGKQTISESGTCTYNGQLVYYDYDDTLVADEEQCVGGQYCLYYSEFEETYYMLSCSGIPEPGTTKVNDIPTYIPGNSYEGDMLWRIVRINEDGSIRIIYNGTSTTATGDNVTIGNSAFNTNYGDNAYVGYMYGATGSSTYALAHANTNNSTIKGVIDDWYTNDTNLPSLRTTHLADAGFCNDRSVAPSAGLWYSSDTALGYAKNVTYYGAYNRLNTNKSPQFACPNASNDLFTTSTSSKGNKALTVPIGLITADEVWYAGATTSTNTTHYLYTGSYYWTMSPGGFYASDAIEWGVSLGGDLHDYRVYCNYLGVRPVVNLKSTVTLSSTNPSGCSSQNGSASCPYIIDTGSSSGTTSYTVSVSSTNTSYGTVYPSSKTVASGSSATFTLNPKSGYAYSSNTCGGTVSGNTMTISNVTANKTCTVTFTRIDYTVSVSSTNTTYGTVSPNSQTVASGSGATFTLNPASGYIYLSNTCGGTVSGNTMIILNIRSNKTCTVTFGEPPLLVDKILRDNIAYADNVSSTYVTASTGIDFSAMSSATNGKGLYYTSTNTEGNQPTYYFRGAVTNNYVQFGQDSSGNDLYWKIIRINEDGSIRIIYNGTSTTATGSDVAIGTSTFNSTYNDNAYVGYMYGTAGSSTYAATHANTNNSTMKDYLDDWYVNNLSSYSSYLADAGFCNDRSVASTSGTWNPNDTALGYAKNITYYGAYNRLRNNTNPQFACPNASNDLFTTSASSKGNKALTNPIGLLTADEVWYAGATTSSFNTTYYLYTVSDSDYLTMSPGFFGGSSAGEWAVCSGRLINHVYDSYRVRPVINLKSTVTLSSTNPSGCSSQNGTASCPYVIG